MKYTIEGFSQEYALGLRKKVEVKDKQKEICIDCTDLVILRWFVDFYPNMKKITVDRREYAWLSYQKMLDDLPILNISRKACGERMQKLVEFGILDFYLLKEGGTFTLYTFGANYINLVSKKTATAQEVGATVQTAGGYRSNGNGAAVQTVDKDTSTSDSSIRNSSSKKESKGTAGSFDALIANYAKGNAVLTDLLGEWLKVRKAKRAAMTDRAISMNLEKLDGMASQSRMTVEEYLKEVICRGWAAFYVINSWGQQKSGGADNRFYPPIKGSADNDDFMDMLGL